eukprot:SAG31_NODE_2778_length_5104_cov_2.424775_4_plen_196_part_00
MGFAVTVFVGIPTVIVLIVIGPKEQLVFGPNGSNLYSARSRGQLVCVLSLISVLFMDDKTGIGWLRVVPTLHGLGWWSGGFDRWTFVWAKSAFGTFCGIISVIVGYGTKFHQIMFETRSLTVVVTSCRHVEGTCSRCDRKRVNYCQNSAVENSSESFRIGIIYFVRHWDCTCESKHRMHQRVVVFDKTRLGDRVR